MAEKNPLHRIFEPIAESDIVILQNNYPSGVRDWIFHRVDENGSLAVMNPIELLGSDRASKVLAKVSAKSQSQAATFSLSRLLVQCLEYRNNNRHLKSKSWDEADLKGENFWADNRTALARDCSVKQAEQFELVMTGQVATTQSAESQYWGAFSALPPVPDEFHDKLLWEFAKQILSRIEGCEIGELSLDIRTLRTQVKGWWKTNFQDFQMKLGGKELRERDRRKVFKRLMSVAVRQSSSMTWQIAFEILQTALAAEPMFSTREAKLFEIRYGSYESLGKINVGFLYGDGPLHSNLLNALGKSLVSESADQEYEKAEVDLYRHVQLLEKSRNKQKRIAAAKRKETRDRKPKRGPGKRTRRQAKFQEDTAALPPDSNMMLIEELRFIADRLRPMHRERVQALITAKGDRVLAAKLCGVSTQKFNQQYRQSTKQRVNEALAEYKRENEVDD